MIPINTSPSSMSIDSCKWVYGSVCGSGRVSVPFSSRRSRDFQCFHVPKLTPWWFTLNCDIERTFVPQKGKYFFTVGVQQGARVEMEKVLFCIRVRGAEKDQGQKEQFETGLSEKKSLCKEGQVKGQTRQPGLCKTAAFSHRWFHSELNANNKDMWENVERGGGGAVVWEHHCSEKKQAEDDTVWMVTLFHTLASQEGCQVSPIDILCLQWMEH